MDIIVYFNLIISVLFSVCYFHQIVYVLVGLITKPKRFTAKKQHKYAVIVSARNEANVVGNLIDSIHAQNYPKELIDTFVVADNCTDDTALVARTHNATVYERFDTQLVGKGYALDWLFKQIKKDKPLGEYDGFIVFDADNIVDPNFITEINKVFDSGYKVVTSYRNSKNYDENWISAGYSLSFIREAKFLNHPRLNLGISCAISGTGFLVSSEILEKNDGWIHHLLTEDIEFTTDNIIQGKKFGYCHNAILYDEQPVTFKQSYIQRLRWAKGFYQVLGKYGTKLIKGIFKGSFSCFDMLMTLAPAAILTITCILTNLFYGLFNMFHDPNSFNMVVQSLGVTIFGFYSMFFVMGALTAITERKRIICPLGKRILHAFTFPLFMLTYVPISIIALFKKVQWVPISHSVSKTVQDFCPDCDTEEIAEESEEEVKDTEEVIAK